MAIDIKKICMETLLNLIQKYPLKEITVKQILEETGISRQTFYNHFMDKNDLIQYIYLQKIIPDYSHYQKEMDFKEALMISFENMKTYHSFMKQACLMEGQNCLKDYIYEHCREFDLKWHQDLYGKKPMPDNLRFATEYHATASSSMTLSWILSDMPVTCEEMATMIVKMRGIGMDKLFEGGENPNPYHDKTENEIK